jgi:hypothetical protein
VLRYLPGIQLWEAFFIKKNHFNEQALFFAISIFFHAGLSSFLPKEIKFKNYFLIGLLFCGSIFLFAPGGISVISVDAVIGIIFAFSLILIYEAKTNSDLVACLILIGYLAITKETAFLLSFLCLFIILLKLIREKNLNKITLTFLSLGLLLVIFNSFSWQRHLVHANLTAPVSKLIIDGIKNDMSSISIRTHDTLAVFFNAILSKPFPSSLLNTTWISRFVNIHGTFLICTIIFIVFLIYSFKKSYEYILGFILGLLGYTSVILMNWLYFSGEYEGRCLASYERYLGMYFLGFSLFFAYIILQKKLYESKKVKLILLAIVILFPPSIKMLYPPSLKNTIPTWVDPLIKIKRDKTRDEVSLLTKKIVDLTSESSRVWLIWQNSTGFQNMIMRYEIGPRKINSWKWSIGTKYYDGDVWTNPMTEFDFISELKGYDYVILGSIDKQFIKEFDGAFQEAPIQSGLYKVLVKNNKAELIFLK